MQSFVFGPLMNGKGKLQYTDGLTRLCLGDQALFFTTGQHALEVLDEQFLDALELCAEADTLGVKNLHEINGPTDNALECSDATDSINREDFGELAPLPPKVLFVQPRRHAWLCDMPYEHADPAEWLHCLPDPIRNK